MSIDFDKPLQTADGREVRIYARDAGGIYPIHGAVRVRGTKDQWTLESWMADGSFLYPRHDRHERNLQNVPPPKPDACYVNIYVGRRNNASTAGIDYLSRADADKRAERNRVGCVRIEAGRWDD